MRLVRNKYGVIIDLNSAMYAMNNDLRSYALAECGGNLQNLFDIYCMLHLDKYGEEFCWNEPAEKIEKDGTDKCFGLY